MIGPRWAKEHVVKRSQFTEDQIAFALKQAELGMSSDARLLLVCHCEREDGDVIRIISARKATENEAQYDRGEWHEG